MPGVAVSGDRSTIFYDLDEKNRIAATGGDWNRFALENGAPELAESSLTGQPIWRYVEGDEVRFLFQVLLDRARQRGNAVGVPFRCDSPSQRRFMTMNVRALPDGLVRVETVLDRVEPRQYIPLLERSPRLLYGMLSMCSWCKRIRLFNRQWVEVEEALQRLNLFTSDDLPALTHGICLECADRTFQVSDSEAAGAHP
jgi:hypothetical protein